MQDPIRSITLPTADRGEITLPEPSWCRGHADHRPDALRADILHRGPNVVFVFRGEPVMSAGLVQAPFTTNDIPELDSPALGIAVTPVGRNLDARSVYELAADLDAYADRLRDLADHLTALEGERGA
ncbi:hypothetical protein [Streptomyces sp. AC512_CC834]|uniref:DUF6907 domain-containing protein n=1 Tax=Streptomyces sp. AC512_CC834 TaxID=2823691 RepID=UPI001C25582C|nr:hypothetical protein [Streptomyces sp. AC512_CC834]